MELDYPESVEDITDLSHHYRLQAFTDFIPRMQELTDIATLPCLYCTELRDDCMGLQLCKQNKRFEICNQRFDNILHSF
jgi:hypothetical protein